MTSRERVHRCMHFQSVDMAPLRCNYRAVAGYYEHGEKLNDLFATLPGDFEPFFRREIPQPGPECFDADGKYHYFAKDPWGTLWEYRIYGVAGIPYEYPIQTPEEAEAYTPPAPPACEGPEYETYVEHVRRNKEAGYYTLGKYGWPNFYEKLLSLYGDENVLCDILMDEPGINKLADRIMEYNIELVRREVKAGVDCVFLGDDYGTERGLIMSPECWRRFIKPRLKEIFKPAVDAGIDVHFHSCGNIAPILPDLKSIGVTSIWPQIPAYNMKELARTCRELELAVEIHTDRAHVMTHGTPEQVRDLVKREFEVFKVMDGGAWFYIEVDNGFPFANVEALVETIAQYR